MRLDDSTREWLDLRRDRLRSAASKCDAASRDWNRRNAELVDKAKRARWDEYTAAQASSRDVELTDAYAAWNFWQQEVRRLSADIQAELAYRQLLALDDDPTGLTYSRADDEPVAAPTRPHDGFHVTGREQRPTNTPAGYASTERRARQVNGRPGSKLPEVSHESTFGMGAVARGAALTVPTLRGGGLR